MDHIIRKSINVNKVSLNEAQLELIAKEYNIKDLDKKGMLIGKLSVYDNTDLHNERVCKGAFDYCIQKAKNNDLDVAINIEHNNQKIVGVLKHIIDDYDCNFSDEPSVFGVMKMFEVPKRAKIHERYNSFSIEGSMLKNERTGDITKIDLTAVALTNSPANPRAKVLLAKSTMGALPQYQFSLVEVSSQEAEARVDALVNSSKEYRKSKMYLYNNNNIYDLLVCDVVDGNVVYNYNLIKEAYAKFQTLPFFNRLSYYDAQAIDNAFVSLFNTLQQGNGVENPYNPNPMLQFVNSMNTKGDIEKWLKQNTDLRRMEANEIAEKCIIEESTDEAYLHIETLEIEYENKVKVVDKSFLFTLSKHLLDNYILQDYNVVAGADVSAFNLQKSIDEGVERGLVQETEQKIVVLSYDDIMKKYSK